MKAATNCVSCFTPRAPMGRHTAGHQHSTACGTTLLWTCRHIHGEVTRTRWIPIRCRRQTRLYMMKHALRLGQPRRPIASRSAFGGRGTLSVQSLLRFSLPLLEQARYLQNECHNSLQPFRSLQTGPGELSDRVALSCKSASQQHRFRQRRSEA